MIKYESCKQMKFENFIHPFGNALDPDNRWVVMSSILPWDEFAFVYYENMSKGKGAPAKSARIVIGSLIIKHKLVLSDEETAEQIRENPYLQFFLGLEEYTYEYAFVPSLFVEIRKRLGGDTFTKLNNLVIDQISKEESSDVNVESKNPAKKSKQSEQKGKLILDATVVEQSIAYPNDLGLLNQSRKITERIIDYLYTSFNFSEKPRTYRRVADKNYLGVAKQRRKKKNVLKAAKRKQLNCLKRNFKSIAKMVEEIGIENGSPIPLRLLRPYWIIQHVYAQQYEMYENNTRTCKDRIVSISQPHVRPIKRGKTGKIVELGSKLGVSLIDGFARIDHLSWDAYHEGKDLKIHLENYINNYGFYPKVVMADNIYGTKENRKLLKELGIRFSGKPLGRPKKETEDNKKILRAERKRRRKEYRERIPIEGKFGQGKNGYRLNYIRAKTKATSESWIHCIFFVMNIVKLVKIKTDFILSNIFKMLFLIFFGIFHKKKNQLMFSI